MDPLSQALQGASRGSTPVLRPLESALLVGAGGVLGSALLAEALVAGRFRRVAALATGPLSSTLRGLLPLPVSALNDGAAALDVQIAFVVFERERHSNGRDDAFVRPDPANLGALARQLRARGLRRLIVVVPHAPALLPQALKHGLASLDEAALAALGFEHLVFVRAAQDAAGPATGGRLQRFARWWLSQLRWMVPTSEQALRAARLAELLVVLARRLPLATPGTRVLAPEILVRAAVADGPEAEIDAWLGVPRQR